MFIDSHAHLNDSRLNYKQITADMELDYLDKIVTVGYDLKSSLLNLKIANECENVYATAGIHPSDVIKANENDYNQIELLLNEKKMVALGEIGLDYHYPNTDKQKQIKYFIKQLQIAKKMKMPIIIHLRDAYLDMREIVNKYIDCFEFGAVMHCFSGSIEEAKFYIERGFYISFSGVITFSNNKCGDIIRLVPKDKLLIETDCPYLTPNPHRGKLNYPKYVGLTAQKVAQELNTSVERIAQITSKNTLELFKKIKEG